MIAVLDGVGFDGSAVGKALSRFSRDVTTATSPQALHRSDRIVIPRTVSYRGALALLRDGEFIGPLLTAVDAGCPILAIAGGMHLLFDAIQDDVQHAGLGVIHGRAAAFNFGNTQAAQHFSTPHQGWNQVFWKGECPLTDGLKSGDYFYFDHSNHVEALDAHAACATSHHGVEFPAIVRSRNIFGVEFLPERSDAAGQTILANFLNVSI